LSESGYTRVSWSGTGIYIRSTHRPVIVELIRDLRELMPDIAATYTRYLDDGPPHPMDLYRREIDIRISKLDTHDESVSFWFVHQLCLRGWEPFETRNSEFHMRLIPQASQQ
jgi:hypothetical protein